MPDDEAFARKSRLREEIEALMKQRGMIIENRITVANMETGETHYFESYPDAMEFLKGKKGRWYITTPGIRYSKSEIL